MAGIKGQPAPKPSSVKSPVPGDDIEAAFAQMQQDVAKNPPAVQAPSSSDIEKAFDSQQTASPDAKDPYLIEHAPAIGGFIGALSGIPGDVVTGGLSSVLGAAALGGVGQSIKRSYEINVMGKPQLDPATELLNTSKSIAKEGLGVALGLGVAKGIGAAAKTGYGEALLDGMADLAAKPISYIKGAVGEAYDNVAQPVIEMISNKTSQLNAEQSGDAVKGLFGQDIQKRFGKFVNAYKVIDNVAKDLPVDDAARGKFWDSAQKWMVDLGGDNYKLAQKWMNDFIATDNAKAFSDVSQQLGGAIKEAAATYGPKSSQVQVLREIRNKAEGFMEDQALNVARKVSAGKATPQEMDAFGRMMMMQANPTVPAAEANLSKYAKSVAEDYIESRGAVKQAYGKFRGFLEDVGEQTKLNPSGSGPIEFLRDIQDVPSEKLIERMFDPKNAAALRAMQAETPEVFDQVVKSKMNQLVQKSSASGKLDLEAFRRSVNKLPESTRNMLMDSEEFVMMNKTLNNPKLQLLQKLEKSGTDGIIDTIAKISLAAGVAGKKAIQSNLPNSPLAREVIGKGMMSLPVPPMSTANDMLKPMTPADQQEGQ